MLTAISKYPFFDLSEIIPDNDIPYRAFKPVKPVKSGNLIPDINLSTDYSRWKNFYNGAPTHTSHVSLKHLYGKPLVIGFYSRHWKNRGIELLKQLNTLQNEVKANGGNMLIINAEEGDEHLAKTTWEHNLSLTFIMMLETRSVGNSGYIQITIHTWNKFSGIDVNIPLLAVYVGNDTARHIV